MGFFGPLAFASFGMFGAGEFFAKMKWIILYPLVNKHSNAISPFLIGNTSSKGPFSIAMLDYRSVGTSRLVLHHVSDMTDPVIGKVSLWEQNIGHSDAG